MIIKNGLVYTPDGKFESLVVKLEKGFVAEVGGQGINENDTDKDIIDASGLYVIPGMVDIHFHGCVGHDFCEGTREAFDAICDFELSQGVTTISPATMTISREQLEKIFSAAGEYDNATGSTIRGITMEGPFISEAKKGAQNPEFIHKPDVEFFHDMQRRCKGLIKQVAVAPEEDTDYAFIKAVNGEVACSVAHTVADYDTADGAFKAGANHVTHLYNGMLGFSHRAPNVIGAAFDNEHAFVELILDGIHSVPSTGRMTFKLFGRDRICMISDSMEATGLVDGEYALGGQPVFVKGKLATLKDGTIAGSASSLLDCLRVAVKEMNIPLEDAVMSCTLTPARSLKIDDVCGSIEAGKAGDVVILDKDLNLKYVIKNGEVALKQ